MHREHTITPSKGKNGKGPARHLRIGHHAVVLIRPAGRDIVAVTVWASSAYRRNLALVWNTVPVTVLTGWVLWRTVGDLTVIGDRVPITVRLVLRGYTVRLAIGTKLRIDVALVGKPV
jgi:hypothetical protein